jgi:hypothetical protein
MSRLTPEHPNRTTTCLMGLVLALAVVPSSAVPAQVEHPPQKVQQWLDRLPVWHSTQLGFDYQFDRYVQFRHGAMAARVASPPEPGSAAARIRRNDTGELITLEQGDLVVAMDETAFFGQADLDEHTGETSIYFRDGRTGRFIAGKAVLPPNVTPSRKIRGEVTFEPKITVSRSKGRDRAPFPRTQAELKGFLSQSIQDGEVRLGTPRLVQPDGSLTRAWLAFTQFSGLAHETIRDQAFVESLRVDLGHPVLNQTMAAALSNVERVIDRKLTLFNQDQVGQIGKERLDQQIEFQYLYAVFAAASARGQPLPPFTPLAVPAAAAPTFFVRLLSDRNATAILYMPRLNWRIITQSQRRQPDALEWSTCKPGEDVGMIGFYAYIARYADGTADPPREDLHITRQGEWRLP